MIMKMNKDFHLISDYESRVCDINTSGFSSEIEI